MQPGIIQYLSHKAGCPHDRVGTVRSSTYYKKAADERRLLLIHISSLYLLGIIFMIVSLLCSLEHRSPL